MTTVGLPELRSQTHDLVRRAEAGERITIVVAGRPCAALLPVGAARWRAWDDVEDLFRGPVDPHWDEDRRLVDGFAD